MPGTEELRRLDGQTRGHAGFACRPQSFLVKKGLCPGFVLNLPDMCIDTAARRREKAAQRARV